ncbi:TPA_asm: hypothetical protein [Phytophthora water mold MELD virus]|nr:TPA_asm: hypothetical protein [Phytophthora water mold MELD virus]
MSLSTYFSDNQTKQKSYDQFYNQKARSDFVQRRKLRAMIAQEAADEALTDKLAQLYMGSVSKAPEYDYDKVLKKVQAAKPEVVKGPTIELPARGGFAENLRANARAARDTPATESDRRSMEFFNDQFNKDTRAFQTTRLFKASSYGDAKKMAQREAFKYVEDYQKRARSDKVNANRVLSPDQEEAAAKKVAKKILSGFKRDRKDSVVSAKPDPKRRLFADDAEDAEDVPDDDVEEKMTEKEIRREKELKSQNPNLRTLYQNIAKNQFINKDNFDSYEFFKKIKHDFTANVDLRNGHGYFKRHFPQPKPNVSNDRKNFDKYKKKLSEAINKAFPI